MVFLCSNPATPPCPTSGPVMGMLQKIRLIRLRYGGATRSNLAIKIHRSSPARRVLDHGHRAGLQVTQCDFRIWVQFFEVGGSFTASSSRSR